MKRITKADSLIQKLEEGGYEAFYVGGCVRDLLRNASGAEAGAAGDIDVTTSATPEEMKDVFQDFRLIETGIRHGTVTVLEDDGEPVEITTYRTDGRYSDHRHPDSVAFVRDLEEDLRRRDFTINAIALDRAGRLRDPFGGEADIRDKVIRAVGDPDRRFKEDALRIMRAMRFAAALGTGRDDAFLIEPETEKAMLRNRELLKNVSVERIFTEFRKLVMGVNAGIVIRRYIDVLGVVFPELLPMKGFDQRNPYHRYDVLEHCVRTMEAVQPRIEYMKMAALFHDIGKPDTFFIGDDGIGHMYGHPARGGEIVREIMKRMKADRVTSDRVVTLVRYHDLVFQEDDRLLKKWLNKYGGELLIEILQIKRADNIATGNMSRELEKKFDRVEERIRSLLAANACFSIKDLAIDGRDVMQTGQRLAYAQKEGPWIGQILDQVLDEVIDGSLSNEREALMERIETIIYRLSGAR